MSVMYSKYCGLDDHLSNKAAIVMVSLKAGGFFIESFLRNTESTSRQNNTATERERR